jgi:hypothetical protein
VKIRDAIKKAPPQGLPTPGAIKQSASAQAPVNEAPAAEVETGGDDQ